MGLGISEKYWRSFFFQTPAGTVLFSFYRNTYVVAKSYLRVISEAESFYEHKAYVNNPQVRYLMHKKRNQNPSLNDSNGFTSSNYNRIERKLKKKTSASETPISAWHFYSREMKLEFDFKFWHYFFRHLLAIFCLVFKEITLWRCN